MTQRIHISIDDATLARLDDEGSRQDRGRSWLVGHLVSKGLNDLDKAEPPEPIKPTLHPGQLLENGRWVIVSVSTWPAVVAAHTMLHELYQWTPKGQSIHTGGSVSTEGQVILGDWRPIDPAMFSTLPAPLEVAAYLEAHQ